VGNSSPVPLFPTTTMIFPFTRELGGGAPLNALNLLYFLIRSDIYFYILARHWFQGEIYLLTSIVFIHRLRHYSRGSTSNLVTSTNLSATTTISNSYTASQVSTMRGITTMPNNITITSTTTRRTWNLRNIRFTFTIRYSLTLCCSVYTWYYTTSQLDVSTWRGTTAIIAAIIIVIIFNMRHKKQP
jgi:hypothetical protein